MSDWMATEITPGFASALIDMLVGRVCASGACCLPAHLEHQWQHDARELLELDPRKITTSKRPEPHHEESGPRRSATQRCPSWLLRRRLGRSSHSHPLINNSRSTSRVMRPASLTNLATGADRQPGDSTGITRQ